MYSFLLQKTKLFLLKRFKTLPQVAIITGSGIKLFRGYKPLFQIKYSKLPFFTQDANFRNGEKIEGHEEKLKLYKIKNKNVLVFSGRRHLYERYNIVDVVLNVRLAYELGIRKIIIINAAGGIDTKFKAGDLMLITGFIDLMQSTERGILSGITQPPYKIKTKLNKIISKAGLRNPAFRKGIYAGVLGPSYETYSEIKLLKMLGASAVGMSTVPEIICAKSLGMDYAGISVISNVWSKKHKPSHKEVLKNVKRANNKLISLILQLLNYI